VIEDGYMKTLDLYRSGRCPGSWPITVLLAHYSRFMAH